MTVSLSLRRRDRFRHRIALEGVAITLVLWIVLFGFAWWHGGAMWPSQGYTVARHDIPAIHAGDRIPLPIGRQERYENLILIVGICTFLLTKIWGMWRRTRRLDHLAASIILTNVAFLWVYLYATGRVLYPDWGMGIWWRRAIRWPLLVTSIYATWQICSVPDLESQIDNTDERIREIRVLRLENAALRARIEFDRPQPAGEGVGS